MDNKLVAIIALIAAVAVVAAGAFFLLGNNNNGGNENNGGDADDSDKRVKLDTPIEVTDALGMKATVNYQVKKVALTEISMVEIFATAYGEGWENLVCMMPGDLADRDPNLNSYIMKTWPRLASLPKCPDLYTSLLANPAGMAQQIVDTEPDLVLLPGTTMAWLSDLDAFYNLLKQNDIPSLNIMFGDSGLTDTIMDANMGVLGKILGKEARAAEMTTFYNNAVNALKNKITDKTTVIYMEMTTADTSAYGNVIPGSPVVPLIGQSVLPPFTFVDTEYNLDKLTAANPDYIILVNTAYYGGKQVTGFLVDKDVDALNSVMASYTSRAGWSDLDAVKDGKVMLMYPELTFTMCDVYYFYNVVHAINDSLVSQSDLDNIAAELSKYLPWEMKGTFSYTA